MKKFNIRPILLAIATLAVTAAHAQYKDLDSEQQAQSAVKQVQASAAPAESEDIFASRKGKLTQIGAAKTSIANVKGFGKQVPFGDALKTVAPRGWNARRIGAVDLGQPVVFGTTGSWIEAVSSFANQTETDITVDWDMRLITVRGASKAVSSTSFIKLADGSSIEGGEKKVKALSDMKPLPPTSWALKDGKSLRENIESWAAEANWRVSWQGANYMITAPANFTGAFDDDTNGPVFSLIEMFSKSEVPLKATFMEDNRVLVIENASYKQYGSKLSADLK